MHSEEKILFFGISTCQTLPEPAADIQLKSIPTMWVFKIFHSRQILHTNKFNYILHFLNGILFPLKSQVNCRMGMKWSGHLPILCNHLSFKVA